MKPILLTGTAAYSPFRLDALRAALGSYAPELKTAQIDARWVYAIQPEGDGPDEETLARAALLLNAERLVPGAKCLVPSAELKCQDVSESNAPSTKHQAPSTFYVTPRKGTISPWSSKATDIFRNCGLKGIARVERGISFLISVFRDGREEYLSPFSFNLSPLYDRMTEGVYTDLDDLFDQLPPKPGRTFDVLAQGVEAIRAANVELGLAISEPEMQYLAESFAAAGRNPTDTELVMFGQVNSEHCRHKIFGAKFIIDGKEMPNSLFGMIKNTHKKNGKGTLVAYKDNSSVVEGFEVEVLGAKCLVPSAELKRKNGRASNAPGTKHQAPSTYTFRKVQLDQLMKVETHNHPTAISPYPGAATGVGGEIRDEAATGSGSRSNAGICGFMVSDLHITPASAASW